MDCDDGPPRTGRRLDAAMEEDSFQAVREPKRSCYGRGGGIWSLGNFKIKTSNERRVEEGKICLSAKS